MKIAVTGDGHCDERSRFDEWKHIHDWMVDDWRERGVQIALDAGDIYERSSTPAERVAVADHKRAVGEFAHQVIVKGNHDRSLDLLLLDRLSTRYPIRVQERSGVVVVETPDETIHGGRVPGARVLVACLPWPNKAGVLKHAAERGFGIEGAELIVHEALQHVLRGLGQQMDAMGDAPRVLLSHAMVRSAVTSVGQPLIGQSMEVSLEDLRLARCDLYALGHVHKPQCWGVDCQESAAHVYDGGSYGDVLYTGSPRRTAFGEIEAKSYVLYDTDTKTWERIETPCAPMLLMEGGWRVDTGGSGRLDFIGLGDPTGAEIRLRYTVAADQRTAAAHAAERIKREWLDAGAVSVVLDPITTTVSTARAPEVAEADTTADQLRAMWNARGEDVRPEREGRLLDKLGQIESEAV